MRPSSDETPLTNPKRPLVSLPFLIVIGVLAVAAYLAGPWVMTRVLLLGERRQAGKVVVPDEFAPLSELAKSKKTDPNASWEGLSIGGAAPSGQRSNSDPEARFAELDQDVDGNLTGDEISPRLAERLSDIDEDGDQSISRTEFMQAMSARSRSQENPEDSQSEKSGNQSSSDQPRSDMTAN